MAQKKERASRKPVPVEKIILFGAASFAAYNFGLAGGYIEHKPFSIGGTIAGLVVNITLAIAASRYGALTGKKRTRQAVIAFVGMMFISPLLVSPVIFYSLPETFLGVWWLRAIWSIAWPLVADLAIVLAGAVSGKGLIALSDAGATQGTGSAPQPGSTAGAGVSSAAAVRPQKKGSADALRSECAALQAQYACTEPQCGWSPAVDDLLEAARAGKSARNAAASAKAGHVKNKHPKPIAIDPSLLISGNQGDKRS